MPVLNFDNLNVLNTKGFKKRAEDYRTYFGDMDLTESQKKERIKAAENFEEDMFFFITLIAIYYEAGYTDYMPVVEQFENRYRVSVGKYINDRDFLSWYTTLFATNMLDVTLQNIADPWYLSNDRAMFNAENEANTILNRSEYIRAIASGYTKKEWVDIRDKRERKTHLEVGGKIIPITQPFEVGNDLMQYPKDLTYSPGADNIVNCRCHAKYIR